MNENGNTISFGIYSKGNSVYKATYSYPFTVKISYDIIYSTFDNPKLQFRENDFLNLNRTNSDEIYPEFDIDSLVIIDENTLKAFGLFEQLGEPVIYKRQTKEDIERAKEHEAIAKKRAIEEQELKIQNIKNNIAKYVYIKKGSYLGTDTLFNDTDYTIDEVSYKYFYETKTGYINENTYGSIGVTKETKEHYFQAHSKVSVPQGSKIISIKSQVLGID
ncbi:hypothetical protein [Dysgonomonas sp. 520]|uniref:hypothetical protein n=1 Tax=Dysgonomonas sp. 520 TaxID=2302931 RepID=UPI0013CFC610|nr:hypothetical protein [Dysgonomonas sp. 520]NDW09428.1 hypothetical protein [Dysgonomonas sp. 520]